MNSQVTHESTCTCAEPYVEGVRRNGIHGMAPRVEVRVEGGVEIRWEGVWLIHGGGGS